MTTDTRRQLNALTESLSHWAKRYTTASDASLAVGAFSVTQSMSAVGSKARSPSRSTRPWNEGSFKAQSAGPTRPPASAKCSASYQLQQSRRHSWCRYQYPVAYETQPGLVRAYGPWRVSHKE